MLLTYFKVATLLAFIMICPNEISGQEKKKEAEKQESSKDQAEKSTSVDTLVYYLLLNSIDVQSNLDYNLMTAASEGDSIGIIWLIKHGAEVDAKTNEGVTPLLFAVASNQITSVKLLLENKADPNVISMYSETPLIVAVKNQYLEIAEILLRSGADINLGDKYNATPLHYASAYGYFYIVDLLIYYNAAIYKKSTDGTTPLMAAVWSGYADIADLLMQNGADPSEKDNLGFSPFLIAAQNGDTVIMNLLRKRRINIYDTNKFKYTALDLSIKGNHIDAIKYLLRIGDKWPTLSNETINPVSVATIYRRKDAVDILKNANIPDANIHGMDQLILSASIKHCFFDYQTGFSVAAEEPVFKLGVLAGIDFKPFYTRILIKENEDTYYQYRDKSSMVYLGILKEIPLTDYPLRGNWSFIASMSAGYTYGNKLKGTSIVPGNKLKLIPAAGFKWTKNTFGLSMDLEYFNTEFYKVGPIWFRLGFSYNMFLNDVRAPGKVIKWY